MNLKNHYIFTALLIFIFFSACTVRKRSYQKGYYLDWAFKKQVQKVCAKQISPSEITPKNRGELGSNNIIESENVTVGRLSKGTENFNEKIKPSINLSDTCGDIMTFKNGEELKVKVTEISDEIIKYKRCDNLGGPVYTVGKEKIYAIKYSNGFKEIIEPPPIKKAIYVNRTGEKGYPKELILAIVAIFLFGGLGSIFSIYWAIESKRKIRANPEVYKGLNLASFILAFNIIIIVGAIALIALLLFGSAFFDLYILLALMLILVLAILVAALYYGLHK